MEHVWQYFQLLQDLSEKLAQVFIDLMQSDDYSNLGLANVHILHDNGLSTYENPSRTSSTDIVFILMHQSHVTCEVM